MLVRRPVLLAVAVLLALAACAGGASPTVSPSALPTVSPSALTSVGATQSVGASASQITRTLPFGLNPLTGYAAHGTVVVDITSGGYTLTVTIQGLDPNSRHIINIHDAGSKSCSSFVPSGQNLVLRVDEVRADATGMAVSLTHNVIAYAIPADGRILTVHGTSGTNYELSHIACADLTN